MTHAGVSPAGQSCTLGRCTVVCPDGQLVCNGRCFDLRSDRNNCGMCGRVCAAGTVCPQAAVVAPGIAEALFATAIGLFVAIPAVIAFNKFNGELNRLAGKLDDFSTEFHMLLSRQLDKGGY